MKKGLAAALVVSGMMLGSMLTMVLNPIGAASALVGSGSSSTHESVLQQALDTLVGKGTINKSQADAVQQQVQSLEQQRRQQFQKQFGAAGPMGPAFSHSFGMGRDSFQQLTTLLKTDAKTLFADLRSGKSIADIAQTKGVPLSSVDKALTTAATQQIDAAVKNGWMTAQQATALEAKLPAQIDQAVHAKWPAGPMMGGFHHGGHFGPQGAPGAPTTAPKGTTTTTTH